jgi:hypothetical protein
MSKPSAPGDGITRSDYLLRKYAAHQKSLRARLKDKKRIGPKESMLAFRLLREAFDQPGGLDVVVPRLGMSLAQFAALSAIKP